MDNSRKCTFTTNTQIFFRSRQFETETDFFSPVPDWDTATTEDVHYKRILSKYKRLCEEKGVSNKIHPTILITD